MKKNAFGVIDLLLGLVVISIIFIAVTPMMKSIGGTNLRDSSINYSDAQKQSEQLIDEILRLKESSAESQKLIENLNR